MATSKIKYNLNSLRNESPHFRGDYVLNKNLCARYNELVIQLKIFLKMMKDKRPYDDIIENLDTITWGHILQAKNFNKRLNVIAKEQKERAKLPAITRARGPYTKSDWVNLKPWKDELDILEKAEKTPNKMSQDEWDVVKESELEVSNELAINFLEHSDPKADPKYHKETEGQDER